MLEDVVLVFVEHGDVMSGWWWWGLWWWWWWWCSHCESGSCSNGGGIYGVMVLDSNESQVRRRVSRMSYGCLDNSEHSLNLCISLHTSVLHTHHHHHHYSMKYCIFMNLLQGTTCILITQKHTRTNTYMQTTNTGKYKSNII